MLSFLVVLDGGETDGENRVIPVMNPATKMTGDGDDGVMMTTTMMMKMTEEETEILAVRKKKQGQSSKNWFKSQVVT